MGIQLIEQITTSYYFINKTQMVANSFHNPWAGIFVCKYWCLPHWHCMNWAPKKPTSLWLHHVDFYYTTEYSIHLLYITTWYSFIQPQWFFQSHFLIHDDVTCISMAILLSSILSGWITQTNKFTNIKTAKFMY